MAEAPITRCNCCHTRDVAILLECHNSACSHYAIPQKIYEGWHSEQAAPAAVAGPSLRDEIQRLAQFADQATRMDQRDAHNNMETMAEELTKLLAAKPTTQPAPAGFVAVAAFDRLQALADAQAARILAFVAVDAAQAVKQCLEMGETFRSLRRVVNLQPEDHELRDRIDQLLRDDAARAQQKGGA